MCQSLTETSKLHVQFSAFYMLLKTLYAFFSKHNFSVSDFFCINVFNCTLVICPHYADILSRLKIPSNLSDISVIVAYSSTSDRLNSSRKSRLYYSANMPLAGVAVYDTVKEMN